MGKRAVARTREAQGFERSPPRCGNCEHYQSPMMARPPMYGQPALPYSPPSCGIGLFVVENVSICDLWTGREGETLDADPAPLPFTFAALAAAS